MKAFLFILQSGKFGGKKRPRLYHQKDELWAIDLCAGFDLDGAVIQLPQENMTLMQRRWPHLQTIRI
jgi:hypothetical protein